MLICPIYDMPLKLVFKNLLMKYVKRRKSKEIMVRGGGGEIHKRRKPYNNRKWHMKRCA